MAKSKAYMAAYRAAKGGEPQTMSLEEYLGIRGLASPISDYTLDTVRIPHGETERQRKKRIADGQRVATEYQERRRAAINEYDRLVESGRIKKPSKIDELRRTARGNPNNQSVQAARRLLKKRGLSW